MRNIIKNHEKGLNCQANKRANRTVPADASALLPTTCSHSARGSERITKCHLAILLTLH